MGVRVEPRVLWAEGETLGGLAMSTDWANKLSLALRPRARALKAPHQLMPAQPRGHGCRKPSSQQGPYVVGTFLPNEGVGQLPEAETGSFHIPNTIPGLV